MFEDAGRGHQDRAGDFLAELVMTKRDGRSWETAEEERPDKIMGVIQGRCCVMRGGSRWIGRLLRDLSELDWS